VSLFSQTHYGVTLEDDPQAPFDFYVEAINPPDPDEVSPIVSDAASNLRAALDHIAWQLAIADLRERGCERRFPRRNTAFPVLGKRSDFKALLLRPRGPLSDITNPAVRRVIRDLQPWNAENSPYGQNVRGLWSLNLLARADKHRLPVEVFGGVAVEFKDGSVTESSLPPGSRDQDRRLTFSFPEGAERSLAVRVKPTVRYSVSVDATTIAAGPSVLRFIHDFIRDGVLPAFEGFVENVEPAV